jgi:hypothetical protein
MLELAAQDVALLNGDYGPAAKRAARFLHRYGEGASATEFVSIASAHVDGCLYHGPASSDFVRSFVKDGGEVRVHTTLNVSAADLRCTRSSGDDAFMRYQSELVADYVTLGCIPSLTCAPYQRLMRPQFGEHIAWAESNAIVFANSVLGARTDRYGDFADLCAALTGRVPLTGMHLAENRKARLIVDVIDPASAGMPRDLYFAALGYCLGKIAGEKVALLIGLPSDATEDELKALGAAAASSGAVTMFHALGVTPEAGSVEEAVGGNRDHLPTARIGSGDLAQAVSLLCPLAVGEPVVAVCLGTPHFSVAEFRTLAALIPARKRTDKVDVTVSTSREIADSIQDEPWAVPLWNFGVTLVVDTCSYIRPTSQKTGAILTNSAKFAHYAPGNLKRRVGLMTLERCLESAVQGEVVS